jgi:ABC-type transport system involved in cytochrome c biogenesis permease subunit
MLSGITVFCFTASYAVAFALEVTRLWFRSGVRGALMLGFAGAGLVAHTLFLGYRAATAEGAPLSSAFDWYLLAAWVLAAMYLFLVYDHPKTAIGIFLLPIVLAMIGMAELSDREPFLQSPAAQVWGMIHGFFLLFGYVAVAVGFVAGVMYLLQARRLKRKQLPVGGLRLPSLEWLDRVNGRAIVLSAVLVAAGFVSGVILNAVNRRHELDYVPWTDPIVWRLGGMMAWLVVAAIFSRFYRPAHHGRKVAYLTVASFVFLAVTLVLRPLAESEHSPRRQEQAAHKWQKGYQAKRQRSKQPGDAFALTSSWESTISQPELHRRLTTESAKPCSAASIDEVAT